MEKTPIKRTFVYYSALWNYGLIDNLHIISLEGEDEEGLKKEAIEMRKKIDEKSRYIGIAYVTPSEVPVEYSRRFDAVVNKFYDADK